MGAVDPRLQGFDDFDHNDLDAVDGWLIRVRMRQEVQWHERRTVQERAKQRKTVRRQNIVFAIWSLYTILIFFYGFWLSFVLCMFYLGWYAHSFRRQRRSFLPFQAPYPRDQKKIRWARMKRLRARWLRLVHRE
jgi:hypothetical protein